MSRLRLLQDTIHPFHKQSWAHNPNLATKKSISRMKNNNKMRSQFCTCHDSWAVVTCANLWPGWITEIMIKSENDFHKISIMSSWSTCTQWVPEVLQVTDLTSKWTVMCLADKPYCGLLLATTLVIWFSHPNTFLFHSLFKWYFQQDFFSNNHNSIWCFILFIYLFF